MEIRQARAKKAATALYTCKMMVSPEWGLTPRTANWLYTTVVRPIMTYGILVWWPIMDNEALRTTPSQALNIILHLLPTDNKGHSRILSLFPFLPKTTDFRNPIELKINSVHDIAFPTREEWERDEVDRNAGIEWEVVSAPQL